MDEPCAKCGSAKVIPLVGLLPQGIYRLRAHVDTNPEAWLFKGTVYAQFSATICGECGHTELTAENPSALYEAYLAAKLRARDAEPGTAPDRGGT